MFGICVGIACGAAELFLLTRITKAITGKSDRSLLPYILSKMVLLAVALALVAVVDAGQIAAAGAAIAAVLIGGAVVLFAFRRKGGRR